MDNSELAEKITNNRDSAFEWQERRHEDWDDNYTLYRDHVIVNRLTQRQSVNLPLMKTVIRTTLSNIDDPPELYFKNLDNAEDREIYYNEYWKMCKDNNNLEIKDIIDKKNVCLYGRSFKKLNVLEGKPYIGIHDPYDILVDRFTDPADIDTAMFIIHQNIYKTLHSLESEVNYDQDEVLKIKKYYESEQGVIRAGQNAEARQARNERMRTLGANDIDAPVLGETWVEVNENFVKLWDEDKGKYIIWFIISCDQAVNEKGDATNAILFKKPLHELIGKTSDDYWEDHYPIDWWGDDVEGADIWSDGIADIVRTPNKVLNAWISQLVENRTLRNLGMQYYDATNEGFMPQTFTPEAWGWYGTPGDPNKIIKRVDVPDLSESLDEMQFIINIVEKATAASATQQGAQSQRQITLGEVQLALTEAKNRVRSMAKFYNASWEKFGHKYVKLIEAAGDKLDGVRIFKEGRNGKKMYDKEINPLKDLRATKGYKVEVILMSEKEENDIQMLQGLNVAMATMPNNAPLREIYEGKLLELARLSPEQKMRVLEAQKQQRTQLDNATAMLGAGTEEGVMMDNPPQQSVLQPNMQSGNPTAIL